MAETNTVVLPAALDIAHCVEIKASLEAALSEEADIALDGAAVEKLDAAGLQMLLSYFKHCQSLQRECHWKQSNELLQESAAGLGLAGELELQSTEN